MLDDCLQELERFRSSDLMDIIWVMIHDLETGVRRFAPIGCSEGIFGVMVIAPLESNMECAVGCVGVTDRGHVDLL